MQISFFEEFPTIENLNKIKLIKLPTKLYAAAKNLESFKKIKQSIKSKKVTEVVYWPILEDEEGYWISPFSKRTALQRIFEELRGNNLSLMLDLELPTTKNSGLYLTQLHNFLRNKKMISDFINTYSGQIYLAEYYPQGKWHEFLLSLLGLHFNHKKVRIIKMVYHSMHEFTDGFLHKEYSKGVKKYGNNFIAGLGTIATGITGNERILLPKRLKDDLELAKKNKVSECIIFRLGGLQDEYAHLIYTKKDILKNKGT